MYELVQGDNMISPVLGANIGFDAELWKATDQLRGSMDPSEYKHVLLGLLFLKYISDAFEEQYAKLKADETQGDDPEDVDEYKAHRGDIRSSIRRRRHRKAITRNSRNRAHAPVPGDRQGRYSSPHH